MRSDALPAAKAVLAVVTETYAGQADYTLLAVWYEFTEADNAKTFCTIGRYLATPLRWMHYMTARHAR